MTLNRNLAGLAVAMVAVMTELVGDAAAATYVVGDNIGGIWKVQPGGAADYAKWASNHVFNVGDVLVFNFTTGNHTVARVTKASFDACNTNDTIAVTTEGPAHLTLDSIGEAYYFCTIDHHCSRGQKLAINVTTSSAIGPSPPPSSTAVLGTSCTSSMLLIVSSVIYGFLMT